MSSWQGIAELLASFADIDFDVELVDLWRGCFFLGSCVSLI
jgi:hypothetical protein